eukprot:3930029-Rhodomonas_salina.1
MVVHQYGHAPLSPAQAGTTPSLSSYVVQLPYLPMQYPFSVLVRSTSSLCPYAVQSPYHPTQNRHSILLRSTISLSSYTVQSSYPPTQYLYSQPRYPPLLHVYEQPSYPITQYLCWHPYPPTQVLSGTSARCPYARATLCPVPAYAIDDAMSSTVWY